MQLEKQEIETLIEHKLQFAEKQYGKAARSLIIEIISLEKMLKPEYKEKKSRLIPLAKWNDYHLYPTVGALRQYKFYKESNGFDKVLVYGGGNCGRILIDEDKLFEWLECRKNNRKDVS